MREGVVWVSAHRLDKPISFNIQVDLVSRALAARGYRVILAEPAGAGHPPLGAAPWLDAAGRERTDYQPGAESLRAIARRVRAGQVIIHGYPDMFPEAGAGQDTTVYLWGQTSGARATIHGVQALEGPLRIVPVTETSGRLFREGGVREVTQAVPHAVDVDVIRPATCSERSRWRSGWGLGGEFVIGCVATNQARKGLTSLLKGFEVLAQKRKGVKLLLRTRGRSGDGGPDLARWARKLPEGTLMVVEEFLPRGRMNELYGLLDLYCQASEWEGFCIPVIEAMAAGVPVAAHDIQGPGELVPYRELLVASRDAGGQGRGAVAERTVDVERLAAALLWAEGHRDELRRLGEIGRQEARRRFSVQEVASRWSGVLAGAGTCGIKGSGIRQWEEKGDHGRRATWERPC